MTSEYVWACALDEPGGPQAPIVVVFAESRLITRLALVDAIRGMCRALDHDSVARQLMAPSVSDERLQVMCQVCETLAANMDFPATNIWLNTRYRLQITRALLRLAAPTPSPTDPP